MNLQDAIRSDKSFKRKGATLWLQVVAGRIYAMNAMSSYENTTEDILADDWEIEEDKPIKVEIEDGDGDVLSIENYFNGDVRLYLKVITNSGVYLQEKDIDKILTFLYNNTEIGKSRIIPF